MSGLREALRSGSSTVSSLTQQLDTLVDPLVTQAQGFAGQAQGVIAPVQESLQPVLDTVTPWLGPVAKTAGGLAKMGMGAKDVYDGFKIGHGKEKVYTQDANGEVAETKRGETAGTKKNAFHQKIGKMKKEKGARKIVGGGLKVASSIPGWASAPGTEDPLWADPVTGALKIAQGGFQAAENTVDASRHQYGYHQARQVDHELMKQGDVRALGFQGAKHHFGHSRDVSSTKAVVGGLKVVNGVVDLTTAVDPTLALSQLGSKALGLATKHTKKGAKAFDLWSEARLAKKLEDARPKADAGDVNAMKYLMSHDPRYASAQMLMHAQDQNAPESERKKAAEQAGKVLRLGEGGQEEMQTGKLSDFDKIYEMRTGRKMDVKAGGLTKTGKLMPYMMALDAGHKVYSKTFGKLKKSRRAKKEARYGYSGGAVEQEFKAIREFRGEKTMSELEDKFTQKDLKEKFKIQSVVNDPNASPQDKADAQAKLGTVKPFEYDASKTEKDAIQEALDKSKKTGVAGKLSKDKTPPQWVLDDAEKALARRRAQQQATPQTTPPVNTLGPPPNKPLPPIPVQGPPPNKPLPPIPVLGPPPNKPLPPIPEGAKKKEQTP